MSRHQLPRTGWLTHTEQIEPGVGDFWHMKTMLNHGIEIVSVDTAICPPALLARLGSRRPPFLTVLMKDNKPVHFEPSETAEAAKDTHYIAVRAAIDGTHDAIELLKHATQKMGQA